MAILPRVGMGYQFTDGNINEVEVFPQPNPTTLTGAAMTATVALLTQGIILISPGNAAAATLTLDTGVNIENLIALGKNNIAFDCYIVSTSTVAAEVVTLTAAAGVTIVGDTQINANAAAGAAQTSAAHLRFVRTALNTWTAYRIG